MKWWGWGDEAVSFDHHDKPALAPFVAEAIDLDLDAPPSGIVDFSALDVPSPRLEEGLLADLQKAVGPDHVNCDDSERVVHSRGKSLRDLVLVRRGHLGRLPDAVVYPGDEQGVLSVMRAVLDHDAVLIVFGGGTNIAGSLEAPALEKRSVVSLDMARMDRVTSIDGRARLARVQAGALGPSIEAQLGEKGWTLGHFPDSFSYSSLGGWIATRSSGMQSDKYGDIADLTRAVRVATPKGVLVTRPVPASSTGPDLVEMVLGSEGRLGVVTEATVQVHQVPARRQILGYLFPDWASGLSAMEAISASDAAPSVTRVSDANETAFSFATRREASFSDRLVSEGMRRYLSKVKRFDLASMCLSFIGYEGGPSHVRRQRSLVKGIVSDHGGLCVGAGPGALYDQKKFDAPYIRDYLLDRGALADVSETAAPWSILAGLYDGVVASARSSFATLGVKGFLMCHMAHSYHSGACLYFTFAFKPAPGREPLEQYDTVKSAIQQEFVSKGATLSHHHAVGTEHARWLADDVSPVGVSMVSALFEGLDPGHNLNPGKIVGPGETLRSGGPDEPFPVRR